MTIISLFKKRPEHGGKRRHGECQRCQRTDYLPWATEDGEAYCGWCHEKDALDYARMRGWRPPASLSNDPSVYRVTALSTSSLDKSSLNPSSLNQSDREPKTRDFSTAEIDANFYFTFPNQSDQS